MHTMHSFTAIHLVAQQAYERPKLSQCAFLTQRIHPCAMTHSSLNSFNRNSELLPDTSWSCGWGGYAVYPLVVPLLQLRLAWMPGVPTATAMHLGSGSCLYIVSRGTSRPLFRLP